MLTFVTKCLLRYGRLMIEIIKQQKISRHIKSKIHQKCSQLKFTEMFTSESLLFFRKTSFLFNKNHHFFLFPMHGSL